MKEAAIDIFQSTTCFVVHRSHALKKLKTSYSAIESKKNQMLPMSIFFIKNILNLAFT